MRVENWCGYDIRFVEVKGEWYAILKDICDALRLKTYKVSQRLDARYMEKVPVETDRESSRPIKYGDKNHDIPLKYNVKSNSTVYMLAINEEGIYQTLFASRRLEARKFQMWTFDVLKKLRKSVGLEGYEVMHMTDSDIQEQIDCLLDTLYWDPERNCIMQSITVQGGDVEQIPFEG